MTVVCIGIALVVGCATVLFVVYSLRQAVSSCHFYSDSGYVIRPWAAVPTDLQLQTVSALTKEWGPGYSIEQISGTWHSEDTFYVMASREGDFLGCVALDRKQLYPFVTNLLVAPEHRRNGYAEALLNVCEQHASDMGFTEVHLWCDLELVPFYVRLGWVPGQVLEGKTVCVKSITPRSPGGSPGS